MKPNTKKPLGEKGVKKYTLSEIKKAIRRAYMGASSDSWNVPYMYECILQARIARDLNVVTSPILKVAKKKPHPRGKK